MQPTQYDSGTEHHLARKGELSGCVPEVLPRDYRTYSDSALDVEIVASVDAAHAHYNGLRRQVVLRLLPALAEMRRRHAAQGARNDLTRNLGLPKRSGWEDYLRSRGLRPDTVRNWFQKYTAAKTLGLLVSGDRDKRERATSSSKSKGKVPRLFQVSTVERVFVVAATSVEQAVNLVKTTLRVVASDTRLEVVEVGQFMELTEVSNVLPQPAPEVNLQRDVPDAVVLEALIRNPAATPSLLAKQLQISAVTVRRVATRHRLHIEAVVNGEPTTSSHGLD